VDTHNVTLHRGGPKKEDPTERFQGLVSSFSTLRHNHQDLVKQLRGSLHELRTLRTRLQQRPNATPLRQHNEHHELDKLMKQFGLTRREAQVAMFLSRGRSNQAIARELQISEHTARHHTQKILVKLEVHSRGEAGAKIRG
jgi:DNA-binding NarL/FixJ family response regulator